MRPFLIQLTPDLCSHVAHSLLPPGLQSDPGPGLGLLTPPAQRMAAWPSSSRAEGQMPAPPAPCPQVCPLSGRAGSWQAVGLASGPLGSLPPWPPVSYLWGGQPRWPVLLSLQLGSVVRVHFLPVGRVLVQRESQGLPPPLPRADPGPQGPALLPGASWLSLGRSGQFPEAG